jgi:histidinol-phosphate aminotransferase
VRPEIRELSAYHVPAAADLIKLDAMENPYSWPADVVDAWLDVLRSAAVNRYPDAGATILQSRLRKAMSVPDGMDLLLGNGSDEIIQIILMAVAGPGRKVLVPTPTFSMYQMIATFVGVECVGVPLNGGDFSLDMPAMRFAIEAHRPAIIFFAYPNNPTGNLFAEADIIEVLETAPGLVVIDEAYHAFANASFVSRLNTYDNLVVLRTLSKMGLAGVRVGMAIGSSAWLDEFNKIRLPYNINCLSQATADFALAQEAMLHEQIASICRDREWLAERLASLRGLAVYPSSANFLLFRAPEGQAPDIFGKLKERGVLIKNLHGAHPQLDSCLRVTVGKPEENQAFLDALMAIL